MKLIQLNVWGGRLDRQINGFIKRESADIVCLQEAHSYPLEESGMFTSVENIQKAGDLAYTAMGPVFSYNYMRSIARFGNCILSKQAIKKTEIIFTHLDHKDDFEFGTDSANVRNFVHCVIDQDGKAFNIITHHGFWVGEHKNGNSETLRQMQLLGDYVDTLDGPVIVTGDFNLAPDSESLGVLNRRLTNLSVEYRLLTTRTSLTHKTEVCDYVFVNDQVQVKEFKASEEIVSDHQALILEFDV